MSESVCVVMASYNGEAFIHEQLLSIVNQTHPVDTILIADDNSSDDTLSVIERFKEEYPQANIQVWKNEANLGYCRNFHSLLEKADADWIFLCDQDDRWHEDKVETMLSIAAQNPQVKALASSFQFMNKDSQVYEVEQYEGWSNNNLIPWVIEKDGLEKITFDSLTLHNYFQGCAMMLSGQVKDLFLEKFTEEIPHDWLAGLCAASLDGLYFYNHPLFDYRIHQSNTTGLQQGKKRSLMVRLREIRCAFYRTAALKDSLKVLDVLNRVFPDKMDDSKKELLDLDQKALDAIENRKIMQYLHLWNHPARNRILRRHDYIVTLAYLLILYPWRVEEGK